MTKSGETSRTSYSKQGIKVRLGLSQQRWYLHRIGIIKKLAQYHRLSKVVEKKMGDLFFFVLAHV